MKIVLPITSISTFIPTFPTHFINQKRQSAIKYSRNCMNDYTKMVTAKMKVVASRQYHSVIDLNIYYSVEV